MQVLLVRFCVARDEGAAIAIPRLTRRPIFVNKTIVATGSTLSKTITRYPVIFDTTLYIPVLILTGE